MEDVTIGTIRQTLTAGEQREYLDPILPDRGEAWMLEHWNLLSDQIDYIRTL